tara:strand:- start:272 stop:1687 length:1416 start_codon:yes stop_codon:yes gene_type:complete
MRADDGTTIHDHFSKKPAWSNVSTIVAFQFGWFKGLNTSIRVPTLLNDMLYADAFRRYNMRMLAIMKPSELEVCERILQAEKLTDMCACVPGNRNEWAHRHMAHRHLARLADGSANLLFAHADMWLNLRGWDTLLQQYGNNTMMTPLDGLSSNRGVVGTSRSACLLPEILYDEPTWGWPAASRELCVPAIARIAAPACCFGWVDVVYLPRHTQPYFRAAMRHFWGVELEVSIPTVINWIATNGIAKHHRVRCTGSSNQVIEYSRIVSHLCAHKISLETVSAHAGSWLKNKRSTLSPFRHRSVSSSSPCKVTEEPGRRFPGRRAYLRAHASSAQPPVCWLAIGGVWLPDAKDDVTNCSTTGCCNLRYYTIGDARKACEASPWCAAVQRDNGITCSGTVRRHQLRLERAPLPRWRFHTDNEFADGQLGAFLMYRNVTPEECEERAKRHNARVENVNANTIDGGVRHKVLSTSC